MFLGPPVGWPLWLTHAFVGVRTPAAPGYWRVFNRDRTRPLFCWSFRDQTPPPPKSTSPSEAPRKHHVKLRTPLVVVPFVDSCSWFPFVFAGRSVPSLLSLEVRGFPLFLLGDPCPVSSPRKFVVSLCFCWAIRAQSPLLGGSCCPGNLHGSATPKCAGQTPYILL